MNSLVTHYGFCINLRVLIFKLRYLSGMESVRICYMMVWFARRPALAWSLFKILCKCLFSEVTVQAVTELDNKAAHCHSPVLQRHRPFPGRRLDCQPHHFFHRVVCRELFTLLIAWRITLFSDSMAFVV